jgi:hypothetical protein
MLGLKAGPALVIVTDPDHGTADTATFTVQPGNAARVVATPQDTAIYVGRTVTLQSSVVDRAGNPRPDAVTHAVIGSAVTVSGSTMSAVSLGTARVVTSSGTFSDVASAALRLLAVSCRCTDKTLSIGRGGLATLSGRS